MRKLASIQKIEKLEPIENADRIEKATILGWELVVKKDEFKVGDLCIYFEIDSVLPKHEVFEFMKDRKYRVKTAKFKKQVSQGLALPINTLDNFKTKSKTLRIGTDVTDIIGVIKHDPEAYKIDKYATLKTKNPVLKKLIKSKHIARLLHKFFKVKFPLKVLYPFPTDIISKTDETRIQNIPQVFKQYNGTNMYYTEKLDGCSATFVLHKGKFIVASRNITLQKNDDDDLRKVFWEVAINQLIEERLRNYSINIAIQIEIVGPGIQENKYDLKEHSLFIYNVFDTYGKRYFTINEKEFFCKQLGFTHVPVLGRFTLKDDMNVSEIVKMSKGFSKLNNKIKREGIVCRSINDDRFSFKAINPEFLLKYDY